MLNLSYALERETMRRTTRRNEETAIPCGHLSPRTMHVNCDRPAGHQNCHFAKLSHALVYWAQSDAIGLASVGHDLK